LNDWREGGVIERFDLFRQGGLIVHALVIPNLVLDYIGDAPHD